VSRPFLVHQAPAPSSGTSTCCEVVTLLVPTLNVTPRVYPLIPPSDLVGSLYTKMFSRRSYLDLCQYFFYIALWKDFGLSWYFRRPTPTDAVAHHLLLLGSSVGPSSFFKWDCGHRYPSTQDVVQPPLRVVFAPHRYPAVSLSGSYGPDHLQR
jgi:hypothetical protein